ncbi:hypothetical protein [Anaplasma phagocytophilum]|uniref:44 kDa major outer membrane protein n=1 Tax=Anaplasma phagocytophilum TaxID=948 RepID=A0A098GKN6_ANAPH|nr:hypothetical protein [Anaplasma phagocytophilum]CEH11083.1 44 kDa major outer membrane protein [Anaplasma phagocytophilum]
MYKVGEHKAGTLGYAVTPKTTNTAQCSGLASKRGDGNRIGLNKFLEDTKDKEWNNWPKGRTLKHDDSAVVDIDNGNAKAVAKDLVEQLSSEEKTKVAGLLAKTIEGGEVVEIRAVSSTSVMVNAEFEIIRLFRRESEF